MFFAFDSLLVQVEPSLQLIRWEWQGAISLAGFQQAFSELMRCAATYGVTRWLADVSHMAPVGPDEQQWLSETWLEQFVALNASHIAVMLPVTVHNQLVLEALIADGRRQSSADVQFFSDIPAALDWLTSAAPLAHQLEQQWQQRYWALPAGTFYPYRQR